MYLAFCKAASRTVPTAYRIESTKNQFRDRPTPCIKRSEINVLIREAERFFDEYRFLLPPWAHWSPDQWKNPPGEIDEIVEYALGWDLTDFGLGDYKRKGLLLFTVRNGHPVRRKKPHVEKIMIVDDRQVTPHHFHWHNMEDIINRGGGMLVIELQMTDPKTEEPVGAAVDVRIDGVTRRCAAGEIVRLDPGESITLSPHLYHSFWAEGGMTLVGEVNMTNDDKNDNRFLDPIRRLPTIEEGEKPYRLLVTDYQRWI